MDLLKDRLLENSICGELALPAMAGPLARLQSGCWHWGGPASELLEGRNEIRRPDLELHGSSTWLFALLSTGRVIFVTGVCSGRGTNWPFHTGSSAWKRNRTGGSDVEGSASGWGLTFQSLQWSRLPNKSVPPLLVNEDFFSLIVDHV